MTGGFGMIAFPMKYRDSSVMTLIVNQNGIVFEKNLGPRHGGDRPADFGIRSGPNLETSPLGTERNLTVSRSRAPVNL